MLMQSLKHIVTLMIEMNNAVATFSLYILTVSCISVLCISPKVLVFLTKL